MVVSGGVFEEQKSSETKQFNYIFASEAIAVAFAYYSAGLLKFLTVFLRLLTKTKLDKE